MIDIFQKSQFDSTEGNQIGDENQPVNGHFETWLGGLKPSTLYSYTVNIKNADGEILKTLTKDIQMSHFRDMFTTEFNSEGELHFSSNYANESFPDISTVEFLDGLTGDTAIQPSLAKQTDGDYKVEWSKPDDFNGNGTIKIRVKDTKDTLEDASDDIENDKILVAHVTNGEITIAGLESK